MHFAGKWNGSNITVMNDPWLSNVPSKQRPIPINCDLYHDNQIVSNLMNTNSTWDTNHLEQQFPSKMVQMISTFPLA